MSKFHIELEEKEYIQCKKFSIKSAKTQREYRSGGTHRRPFSLIYRDTLQGKTAEMIVKKFLEKKPFEISGIELDFEVYERGKWDDKDFSIGRMTFSIKSAKWFSSWLLLETKDILRGDVFDVYVFVTVDKNYKSGDIKGFITQEELLKGSNTLKLKKGELIPGTQTHLDADNYAVHSDNLHNLNKEWDELLKGI